MQIGFIGYGNMAKALASRWVGHRPVAIGGRNPDKARALADELGGGTRWGSSADVVRDAEVVVLATRHEGVFEAMDAAGGPSAFAGKTLIDINNPVPGIYDGDFLNANYDGLSLAEKIAAYAPGAGVVKAFNMCQASVWTMDPPPTTAGSSSSFTAGNDAAAKDQVVTLIEQIGCDPVDLGEFKYARLSSPRPRSSSSCSSPVATPTRS